MILHNLVNRIFEKRFKIKNFVEVESQDGWHKIDYLNITPKIDVIKIITNTGRTLKCANDHIIFDENYNELFAKDSLLKNIITINGIETVVKIEKCKKEKLYDLSLKN